jgi:hypothetical protein
MIGFILLVMSSGCTDMYNGNRMKPMEESTFYADKLSSRPLVDGTVARGHARNDSLLYTGKSKGQFADMFPIKVTKAVLDHGRERFNTFCSPCHGRLGNGRGMIVMRGFPQPNSFHSDSVRSRPAGYYFDIITNGFGRMYSYAPSIPVEDRWTIVAYIRALQASQNVSVSGLSEAEQKKLLIQQ